MAELNLQPIRDKMMEDLKGLEKTCENCEYEHEDMEGTHCRHCIHSAEEHFKPKEIHYTEQEIRNKAIDEYKELLIENNVIPEWREVIEELAEQMKGE